MKKTIKSFLALLTAITVLVAAIPFGSLVISAETEEPDYETVIDYGEIDAAGYFDGANAALGIDSSYALCHGSSHAYNPTPNWLTASWSAINSGLTENPYAVYSAMGGTPFRITVRYHEGAVYDIEVALNKAFAVKLYYTTDLSSWNELGAVTETNFFEGEAMALQDTLTVDVLPKGTKAVKAVFPQEGKMNELTNDEVSGIGNDYIAIEKVEFTKYSAVYGTTVDYNSATAATVTDDNMADYGLCAYNDIAVGEYTYRDKGIYLGARWADLETEGADPYAVYKVEPFSEFKLVSYVSHASVASLGSDAYDWAIKLYTSTDGVSWTLCENAVEHIWSSNDATVPSSFGRADVFSITVPEDVYFVKADFPHVGGNISGTNRGNDYIGIKSVSYTPYKEYTASFYNYNLASEVRINSADGLLETYGISDLTTNPSPESTGYYAWFFDANGIRAGWGYLNTQVWGTVNPHIVYNVKGGTTFTADGYINPNAAISAWESANNAQMEFVLEASVNGSDWIKLSSTGDATGAVSMSAQLKADVKYVRIVFPQKGKSASSAMGNDFISLTDVSFVPVNTKYDYLTASEAVITDDNMAEYGIAAYNGMSVQNTNRIDNNGTGTTHPYLIANSDYLINNTDTVAYPYVVYNVESGTQFKTAFNVAYSSIGYKTNTHNYKVYLSKDGSEWTEKSATPDITWAATDTTCWNGGYVGNYSFTVDEGMNFVKLEYPMSQKHSDTVTGNDFAAIQYVDFVQGNAKFANIEVPSTPTVQYSNYNRITLNGKSGLEYSLDGETWQKSNVITGVYIDDTVTVYARYAETDTTLAGNASEALVYTVSVLTGDIDVDGNVDATDLVYLRKYLLESIELENYQAADTNGDTNINIIDLVRLKEYLSGAAALAAPDGIYTLNSRGISENSLNSYLSSAVTSIDMLSENGNIFNDQARMIDELNIQYVSRAYSKWLPNQADLQFFSIVKNRIKTLKSNNVNIILEAAIYETAYEGLSTIGIPASVFEAFGLEAEDRSFDYYEMLYDDGRYADYFSTESQQIGVPDITRTETQMFYYYRARQFIDMGFEALHFGNFTLTGENDTDNACYTKLIGMIRDYAKKNAKRGWVLITGHDDSFSLKDSDGNLLLDFNTYPTRIEGVEGSIEKDVYISSDSIYSNSGSGVTPSGWETDSLPYTVEFDNYGGLVDGDTIFGYDEISWFANQSFEYKSDWLPEFINEVKVYNDGGHLTLPLYRNAYLESEEGMSKYNASSVYGCGDEAIYAEILK